MQGCELVRLPSVRILSRRRLTSGQLLCGLPESSLQWRAQAELPKLRGSTLYVPFSPSTQACLISPPVAKTFDPSERPDIPWPVDPIFGTEHSKGVGIWVTSDIGLDE
jgi:hypothetical protein